MIYYNMVRHVCRRVFDNLTTPSTHWRQCKDLPHFVPCSFGTKWCSSYCQCVCFLSSIPVPSSSDGIHKNGSRCDRIFKLPSPRSLQNLTISCLSPLSAYPHRRHHSLFSTWSIIDYTLSSTNLYQCHFQHWRFFFWWTMFNVGESTRLVFVDLHPLTRY